MAVIIIAIELSQEESRTAVQGWTINATSGMAFATSLWFTLRLRRAREQISAGLSFLAVGLLLWFVAESLWNYQVSILQVEVPFPSVADIFYLAAYVPVGLSLYKLSRSESGVHQESRLVITTVAVTLTAFITNVFILQIVDSAIGFTRLTSDDIVLLIISIAYPLLDGLLFVPSIIIVYSLRKSSEHLTWVLIAASMLLMAAADFLLALLADNAVAS